MMTVSPNVAKCADDLLRLFHPMRTAAEQATLETPAVRGLIEANLVDLLGPQDLYVGIALTHHSYRSVAGEALSDALARGANVFLIFPGENMRRALGRASRIPCLSARASIAH